VLRAKSGDRDALEEARWRHQAWIYNIASACCITLRSTVLAASPTTNPENLSERSQGVAARIFRQRAADLHDGRGRVVTRAPKESINPTLGKYEIWDAFMCNLR